jgi:hypothetical protein
LVVIAGYLMLGDVSHGREFFLKARDHLSYVFDSSNYDVACLLKHMVLHHFRMFLCIGGSDCFDAGVGRRGLQLEWIRML